VYFPSIYLTRINTPANIPFDILTPYMSNPILKAFAVVACLEKWQKE